MIDQDKMRALAARLRDESSPTNGGRNVARKVIKDAADAIDLLLAEVEASNNKASYFESACALADDTIDSKNRNIDEIVSFNKQLLAELEAAAADKRDAERYRYLRSRPESVEPDRIDVVYWSALDESANEGEGLRSDALDTAIDAVLAQRQGEGS